MNEPQDIREAVKDTYGKAVKLALKGGGCRCGASSTSLPGTDPITKDMYTAAEAAEGPQRCLPMPCWRPSAAAIPRRWQS